MRVLVVGEGPHEACALPVLVRRLQPATTETPFDFVKNGRRVHGKGRGMFKKAVGWMLDAQSLQYDALVFLTDEDGDRSRRGQGARQVAETEIEEERCECPRSIGLARGRW